MKCRAFKTLTLTFLPRHRGCYILRLDVRGNSLQQLRPGGRSLSASAAGDSPSSSSLSRPSTEGGLPSPKATRKDGFAAGSSSCSGKAPAGVAESGGGPQATYSPQRRTTDTSVRCNSSPAAAGSNCVSSSSSKDSTLLCSARLTAQAHWPSVLVTGVKCEGMPPQVSCWLDELFIAHSASAIHCWR
jgi:hypothetical protein